MKSDRTDVYRAQLIDDVNTPRDGSKSSADAASSFRRSIEALKYLDLEGVEPIVTFQPPLSIR